MNDAVRGAALYIRKYCVRTHFPGNFHTGKEGFRILAPGALNAFKGKKTGGH